MNKIDEPFLAASLSISLSKKSKSLMGESLRVNDLSGFEQKKQKKKQKQKQKTKKNTSFLTT